MGIYSNPMKITTLLLLLTLSSLLVPATTNNGSISIELSSKGIDFAKDVLIKKALASLIPLELPDIDKSAKIPIIGTKVQVGLSNIYVYSASVGFSSVETGKDGTFWVLVASGVQADLDMNWSYSYKGWFVVVSDSGGASVKVNDMEVRLALDVKEQNGTIKLSFLDCECSVRDISIKLNGGASWLYQVLVDAFEGPIGSAIENAVAKKIKEGISELNDKFQSIPKQIAVDHVAALNVTFVDDPYLSNSSIGFDVDGLFVASDDSFGENFFRGTRVASASCKNSSKMIAILVHEHVFDSAASIYFSAGYMHWMVDKFIDQSLLNTSSWKYVYPELYKQYPNEAMNLNVSVESPPVIKILDNGIDAMIDLGVVVNVLDANEVIPVASVSLEIHTSGTPQIVRRNLAGMIKLKSFTVVLKWSKIGSLHMHLLESLTSTVLKTLFIPYVNTRLMRGFPLPILRGFTLKNTEIHCIPSRMLVCSNLAST